MDGLPIANGVVGDHPIMTREVGDHELQWRGVDDLPTLCEQQCWSPRTLLDLKGTRRAISHDAPLQVGDAQVNLCRAAEHTWGISVSAITRPVRDTRMPGEPWLARSLLVTVVWGRQDEGLRMWGRLL